MKVVGHRGAAGLSPENTLPSIKKALALGVDAIEIDVQLSKDKVFVLSHDGWANGKEISKTNSKDLDLPTLEQALNLLADTLTIIDIKVWHTARLLCEHVQKYTQQIHFTGSYAPDIATCKRLLPDKFSFVSGGRSPWTLFSRAHACKADGLSINWWLINPITYWIARVKGYEVMVYTVDNKLHCKLLGLFYPKIWLCTNRPDLFI